MNTVLQFVASDLCNLWCYMFLVFVTSGKLILSYCPINCISHSETLTKNNSTIFRILSACCLHIRSHILLFLCIPLVHCLNVYLQYIFIIKLTPGFPVWYVLWMYILLHTSRPHISTAMWVVNDLVYRKYTVHLSFSEILCGREGHCLLCQIPLRCKYLYFLFNV